MSPLTSGLVSLAVSFPVGVALGYVGAKALRKPKQPAALREQVVDCNGKHKWSAYGPVLISMLQRRQEKHCVRCKVVASRVISGP